MNLSDTTYYAIQIQKIISTINVATWYIAIFDVIQGVHS